MRDDVPGVCGEVPDEAGRGNNAPVQLASLYDIGGGGGMPDRCFAPDRLRPPPAAAEGGGPSA